MGIILVIGGLFVIGILVMMGEALLEGLGDLWEENQRFRVFIVSTISMFFFWNLINHFDFFYFLLRNNGSINWAGITLCSLVMLIPIARTFLKNKDTLSTEVWSEKYEKFVIEPKNDITSKKYPLWNFRDINFVSIWIIVVWLLNITGLPSAIYKYVNKPSATNEMVIADGYFEAFLVSNGIDDKIDKRISERAVYEVERLDFGKDPAATSIKSLDGIEKFQYLKTLIISAKEIKYLDLSNNKRLDSLIIESDKLMVLKLPENLKFLMCNGSSLKTLDLSKNHKLEYVNIDNNDIEVLELPNKPRYSHLKTLSCSDNRLKKLDVSKSPLLSSANFDNNMLVNITFYHSDDSPIYELKCSNNQLAKLSIPKGVNKVDCSNNQLTNLSIPKGVNTVDCSNNKLTELTVPSSLRTFDCSNNSLSELNLSNAIELSKLDCSVNKLNSLVLNGTPHLAELNIKENKIHKINLVPALALESIYFDLNTTEVIFDKAINQKLDIEFTN
jgi:hypothetical protein